jgi:hypothetical protein
MLHGHNQLNINGGLGGQVSSNSHYPEHHYLAILKQPVIHQKIFLSGKEILHFPFYNMGLATKSGKFILK